MVYMSIAFKQAHNLEWGATEKAGMRCDGGGRWESSLFFGCYLLIHMILCLFIHVQPNTYNHDSGIFLLAVCISSAPGNGLHAKSKFALPMPQQLQSAVVVALVLSDLFFITFCAGHLVFGCFGKRPWSHQHRSG